MANFLNIMPDILSNFGINIPSSLTLTPPQGTFTARSSFTTGQLKTQNYKLRYQNIAFVPNFTN